MNGKRFLRLIFSLVLMCVWPVLGQNAEPHFLTTPRGDVKAWVFFKDKGPAGLYKNVAGETFLTKRSLRRRSRRTALGSKIRFGDYPVYTPYLQQIKPLITGVRIKSRWLNAVSVECPPAALRQISGLPFVRKVQPVAGYTPEYLVREDKPRLAKTTIRFDSTDYGPSQTQADLIKIPELHRLGLNGQGVLICMLDDGFNLLYLHRALKHLNIVATRDFVDGDDDVTNSGLKGTVGWHGTHTLSIMAGFLLGDLIGPAYGASFILARTEIDQQEIPTEEDYWVAGLEWADSLGADLVSSSLGYIDWYTWMDMDGETAVTTVAADSAAARGLLIFNSAGNEGDNPDHNTLIAPADGKNVLAIAAVDQYGVRAAFSSVGPSADGRPKPDLAAMGSGVYSASSRDTTGFNYGGGTSYSCPLAAGATALLLQAFPQATAEQVRQALRKTASQSLFPDKYLGWGIIDIKAAYDFLDSLEQSGYDSTSVYYYLSIWQNVPNPASEVTRITIQVRYSSLVGIQVYNVLGEEVAWLETRIVPEKQSAVFTVDVSHWASGVYFYQVRALIPGIGRLFHVAKKMMVIH